MELEIGKLYKIKPKSSPSFLEFIRVEYKDGRAATDLFGQIKITEIKENSSFLLLEKEVNIYMLQWKNPTETIYYIFLYNGNTFIATTQSQIFCPFD
jgi:hypothetical protein